MKTTMCWLLLAATLSLSAQREVDTQWANDVNSVFANLDFTRVPHDILLDYAIDFIDVPSYNGVINTDPFTTTTYADVDVIGNIYKTLFMGKLSTDTTHFRQLKVYAQDWLDARNNYNQTSQNTLVLGGLFYNYSRIKETALDDDNFFEGAFFFRV